MTCILGIFLKEGRVWSVLKVSVGEYKSRE